MKNILTLELNHHVSFTEKLLFTKHLAMMVKSGIPLAAALNDLHEQTKSHYFREVLAQILHDVKNGQKLSVSLRRFPKVFSLIYVNLIEIGEESGTLERNLEYLALQLKKEYEFKKKVQSASLYPGLILFTAAIICIGISVFVLPRLVEVFESLDVTLPLSTIILLFIAKSVREYGIFIGIGIVMFFVFARWFISLRAIKPYWQTLLFSLPLVGTFLQQIQVASLCRNLGIMLKSGLPILSALQSLRDATNNVIFKSYVIAMHSAVEQGTQLGLELHQPKYRFFPLLVSNMIKVGEETGKLDETLSYLGDFYEEEVDSTAKNFTSILEPVLLLVIGLVVAFMALAIISPIYQITGGIQ